MSSNENKDELINGFRVFCVSYDLLIRSCETFSTIFNREIKIIHRFSPFKRSIHFNNFLVEEKYFDYRY